MTKKTTKAQPILKVKRTSLGLRDALFDEIDALRTGESNPARAMSIAKLAVQIINSAALEIEMGNADNALRTVVQSRPVQLGSML